MGTYARLESAGWPMGMRRGPRLWTKAEALIKMFLQVIQEYNGHLKVSVLKLTKCCITLHVGSWLYQLWLMLIGKTGIYWEKMGDGCKQKLKSWHLEIRSFSIYIFLKLYILKFTTYDICDENKCLFSRSLKKDLVCILAEKYLGDEDMKITNVEWPHFPRSLRRWLEVMFVGKKNVLRKPKQVRIYLQINKFLWVVIV